MVFASQLAKSSSVQGRRWGLTKNSTLCEGGRNANCGNPRFALSLTAVFSVLITLDRTLSPSLDRLKDSSHTATW